MLAADQSAPDNVPLPANGDTTTLTEIFCSGLLGRSSEAGVVESEKFTQRVFPSGSLAFDGSVVRDWKTPASSRACKSGPDEDIL
jgi:hypothetical protein